MPKPVPFWSLQFGGLRAFPVIKIILIRQVRVLPACTAVWVWNKHALNAARHPKIVNPIVLHLVLHVLSAKTRRPQIEPHRWQCHYMGGGIGSLVSLVYICEQISKDYRYSSDVTWLSKPLKKADNYNNCTKTPNQQKTAAFASFIPKCAHQ